MRLTSPPALQVSIRKSCDGGLASAGAWAAARWLMVRDLRLLRVFAVVRGGCGWRGPGCGGC